MKEKKVIEIDGLSKDPEIKKFVEKTKKRFNSDKYKSGYMRTIPEDVFRNFNGSPSQFRILCHIFDQTIGYRKLWDRIGRTHFVKYTNLSPMTILKGLHWLNGKWIYTLYQCIKCKEFFDKAYNPCPLCKCPRSYYAYYSPILNEEILKKYQKIFKVPYLEDFVMKNDIPVYFLDRGSIIFRHHPVYFLYRTTEEHQQNILNSMKKESERSEITDLSDFSEKFAFTEKVISFWDGLRLSSGWKPVSKQGKGVLANQKRIVNDWYNIYPLTMVKSVLSEVVGRFVLTHIGESIQSLKYFEKALDKKNPSPSTPATPSPKRAVKKVSEGIYRQV